MRNHQLNLRPSNKPPFAVSLPIVVVSHVALTGVILAVLLLDRTVGRQFVTALRLVGAALGFSAGVVGGYVIFRNYRDGGSRVFAVAFALGGATTLANVVTGGTVGSLLWIWCSIVASTVTCIALLLRKSVRT